MVAPLLWTTLIFFRKLQWKIERKSWGVRYTSKFSLENSKRKQRGEPVLNSNCDNSVVIARIFHNESSNFALSRHLEDIYKKSSYFFRSLGSDRRRGLCLMYGGTLCIFIWIWWDSETKKMEEIRIKFAEAYFWCRIRIGGIHAIMTSHKFQSHH